MTRKEIEIREKAVLFAYRDNDVDKAAKCALELYQRNKEKKLYRFRRPNKHEVDAIRNGQIYLCRPGLYDDLGDCEWIDDIEALAKYDVTIQKAKIYESYENVFTPEEYRDIAENIRSNPKYKEMMKRVRNSCLTACITDKMTDYMWKEYASDYEGVCLEYKFEDVLYAVSNLGIRFFPVRYVENRKSTQDIKFGPQEYFDDATEELMRRKYILSCMTKDKHPYSRESEWRLFYERIDNTVIDGQLFNFIQPSKIYLGKNIHKNKAFKKAIIDVAEEFNILITQQ